MSDSKTLHRFWWFSRSDAELAGAWLNSHAAEGWQLQKIGLFKARFVWEGSSQFRYVCVSKHDSISDCDDIVENRTHTGWQLVASGKGMLVFRRPLFFADKPDLQPEETEIASGKRPSRKYMWCTLGSSACLVACALLVYFSLATTCPMTEKVNDLLLERNNDLLFFLFAFFVLVVTAVHSLYKALTADTIVKPDLSDPAAIRSAVSRARFNYFFVRRFYLLLFAVTIAGTFLLSSRTSDPPKDAVTVSVREVQQFSGDVQARDDGEIDRIVFKSSPLFPEQLVIRDSPTGKARLASAYLEFEAYRSVSSLFASVLADNLARLHLVRGDAQPQRAADAHGFDQLWVSDPYLRAGIVARLGECVYYLSCESVVTVDDLIETLKKKELSK